MSIHLKVKIYLTINNKSSKKTSIKTYRNTNKCVPKNKHKQEKTISTVKG